MSALKTPDRVGEGGGKYLITLEKETMRLERELQPAGPVTTGLQSQESYGSSLSIHSICMQKLQIGN
ncbi:unnamed protein product [Caretta caretta]